MFPEHQNCANYVLNTYTKQDPDLQRMLPTASQVDSRSELTLWRLILFYVSRQ